MTARRVLGILSLTCLMLAPLPAWADHERSRCGGEGYSENSDRYGCDQYGGQGNHNRRREEYNGAGCKYVCPSFDKSPVHDAFNFSPFVCMPGATCYEDPHKRDEKGDQDGQQPSG